MAEKGPEELALEVRANFVADRLDVAGQGLTELKEKSAPRFKTDPRVADLMRYADFLRGIGGPSPAVVGDRICLDPQPVIDGGISCRGMLAPTNAPPDANGPAEELLVDYPGQEDLLYNRAVLLYHSRRETEASEELRFLFRAREGMRPTTAVRVSLLYLAGLLDTLQDLDEAQQGQPPQGLLTEIEEAESYLKSKQPVMEEHDAEVKKMADSSGSPGEGDGEGPSLTPLMMQYRFLKGKAHMAMGRHSPAIRGLLEDLKAPAASSKAIALNNLGVVHMKMGKPHLATLYFQRALTEFQQAAGLGSEPPSEGGSGKANSANITTALLPSQALLGQLMMNNGVCLLMRKLYDLAYRSFIVASPVLHYTPKLWIRMAECCIRKFESGVDGKGAHMDAAEGASGGATPVPNPGVASHFSTLALPSGARLHFLPYGENPAPSSSPPSPTAAPPAGAGAAGAGGSLSGSQRMTLGFADRCLRNAYFLLARDMPGDGEEGDAAADGTEGGRLRLEKREMMLHSVILNLAYTNLAAQNPSASLYFSRTLLAMKRVSQPTLTAVKCYAAEALCWLNHPISSVPGAALPGLNEITTALGGSLGVAAHGEAPNLQNFIVNWAVVHLAHDKAPSQLSALSVEAAAQALQKTPHGVLLDLYLGMMRGNFSYKHLIN